ncbi:MAG: hypothetical protein HYT41_02855 [Candidatus Sungbacteria bacterium]|nr:hypothetical protein [Candidatus Sungbacteria bacterium]
MKYMRFRFFVGPLIIALLAMGAVSPRAVSAQSAELPFGGIHLFTTQCTCAADSLHYVINYATDDVIALLYEPSSQLFQNYNVYGGLYQLGSYMPTGQQCMITTGTSCVGIYADGMYGNQPGTGTSFHAGFRALAGAFAPLWGGQSSHGSFLKVRPTVLRRSARQ